MDSDSWLEDQSEDKRNLKQESVKKMLLGKSGRDIIQSKARIN